MTIALIGFLAIQAAAPDPQVRAALDALRTDNAWTLEQQVSLCEIPAPPFAEARRAAEFSRRLEALGVRNVRIDSVGNVIGVLPGRRVSALGESVILSGHLDTVFPESTDVRVRREGTRYRGPGIGDDCRGLAVILAVARAMTRAGVQTDRSIMFVATVGEEGPGNLRGVRHLFRTDPTRTAAFISVDGGGTKLVSSAVGSHRYRVTFRGPGGHSYLAFGMPNPVHAAGRALARIAEIQVPDSPRTTFSAGIIRGGTSVNTITQSASFDMDLRSVSGEALGTLDAAFRRAVQQALADERARWPNSTVPLDVTIDTIGIRPTGSQPADAPIVRAARAAAEFLGITPVVEAQSTDANIPISLGVPAVTLEGGGTADGSHSLSEWYDDGDRGWLGPQWALLLTVALARRQ